jgi:carbonic anhydrase
VNPNLVTQTQPGELFVVRNLGNIVPPYGSSSGGEEAVIEFAIDGLRVTNIVLSGHTQCGAVAGLMGKMSLDKLPSVNKWLGHAIATRKRLEAVNLTGEIDLNEAVEENVLVQVGHLKTHPTVAAALKQNRIKIFGWVYHFETGGISIYDSKNQRFTQSKEVTQELMGDGSRFAI